MPEEALEACSGVGLAKAEVMVAVDFSGCNMTVRYPLWSHNTWCTDRLLVAAEGWIVIAQTSR